MKFKPVFDCYVGFIAAYNIVIDGVKTGFVGECRFRFVVDVLDVGIGERDESIGYDVACLVHAW